MNLLLRQHQGMLLANAAHGTSNYGHTRLPRENSVNQFAVHGTFNPGHTRLAHRHKYVSSTHDENYVRCYGAKYLGCADMRL